MTAGRRRSVERGAAAATLVLALASVGAVVASSRGPSADRPPEPASAQARAPAAARARASRPFPTARNLRAARTYAQGRSGTVSWAVADTRGRVSGLESRRDFRTASVVKAMLLVGFLDRADRRARALAPWERGTLRADDHAVGQPGRPVAPTPWWATPACGAWPVAPACATSRSGATGRARTRARPTRRASSGAWTGSSPPRHRRYARTLLADVVDGQRWGVPRGARGWGVRFKGGWRRTGSGRLVHQAALLTRGRMRIGLAVLTDGNPSHEYGAETIRGVTARLVREPRSGGRY